MMFIVGSALTTLAFGPRVVDLRSVNSESPPALALSNRELPASTNANNHLQDTMYGTLLTTHSHMGLEARLTQTFPHRCIGAVMLGRVRRPLLRFASMLQARTAIEL